MFSCLTHSDDILRLQQDVHQCGCGGLLMFKMRKCCLVYKVAALYFFFPHSDTLVPAVRPRVVFSAAGRRPCCSALLWDAASPHITISMKLHHSIKPTSHFRLPLCPCVPPHPLLLLLLSHAGADSEACTHIQRAV